MGTYLGSIFNANPLLFSLPTVILVTVIHLGSLTFISGFQQFFTYSKFALILVLGALGFAVGQAQDVSFLPADGDVELITSGAFAISLVYVLYAYAGWNLSLIHN